MCGLWIDILLKVFIAEPLMFMIIYFNIRRYSVSETGQTHILWLLPVNK
jgi:hypothetical protein